MMNFLERAKELEPQLIEHRRYIHKAGGVGFDIMPTTEYVMKTLRGFGYSPEIMAKSGVVCTAGQGDKTILLRADMDALPMEEKSGLSFACTNGTAHTCGHDTHTAMLLGAAKMLKEREAGLKGVVKFMFQPAEETMGGAEAMIKAGILEQPHVNAAFSMHNVVGNECPGIKAGAVRFTPGATYSSLDTFEIIIKGFGCHGAKPETGIDPITIGAKIITAIHEMLAMELPSQERGVLTIGQFQAGDALNVIPETAILRGSIRTHNTGARTLLKKRLTELTEMTAKTYRGEACVNFLTECPGVYSDLEMSREVREYFKELIPDEDIITTEPSMASEDFGLIASKVPSVMIGLSLGSPEEGYIYGGHNPQMVIDEKAMYVGAALYAQVAYRWLESHT